MYDEIKEALSPFSAPLKFATGPSAKMERWVEHYAELSTRENMMSLEALNSIEYLPVLEDLDSEPTEPSEGSPSACTEILS